MNQNIPLALAYDDVLLIPQYSTIKSRSDVDLSTQITPRVKIKLPIISINMTDVTGVDMAIALGKIGGIGFLPRFVSAKDQADMIQKVIKQKVMVGAAVGCKKGYLERAEYLAKAGANIITLDVAHGAMQQSIEATKKLKSRFGKTVDIISGVVATKKGADDLFDAGADSVRVGLGPGTICTTRTTTGVGVPQITACIEGVKAARNHKKTILCDGGTKNSGDIVKGLATGASAVLIGSQLAGTDEAPGQIIKKGNKTFKVYNASTSIAEKENHVKNNSKLGENYLSHIEGVKSLVPYKGPVEEIVQTMQANIKSGFSYLGAKNIKELWKKAEFVRISPAGIRESSSHDVIIK